MKSITPLSLLKDMSYSTGYTALAFLSSLISKLASIKDHWTYPNKTLNEKLLEKLLQQNVLKDQLLMIVAHDVQTPLNSLKAILTMASNQKLKQKELQNLLINIDNQVDQLSHFLENILRWAKSNSVEIKPKYESIQLHRLVRETIELLQLQATIKQVRIQVSMPESLVVFTDEEMIKLILRNLISNAIKFSNTNGTISVGATAYQGMVTVFIEDTGRGMSIKDISKLFEPAHLTTRGNKNEIGTGIGLLLCKEFVEKMGGKIAVSSIENKGSRFEFSVHTPTAPPLEFTNFIESQDHQEHNGIPKRNSE